ncbi:unnamed protein product [Vitrella brassicaformis CCMP3155]|uniref:Uncharacterized protein n=1 Tax=Vitrella brassicaformis (strain CCMP3155) TaxID=1169540 RepID=A0A0G4G384_VITBC|nr:unnamed protein product [Vitrella brassicaformis CCMP3155]|eukprot:CEM22566.1 unnamed protein product [Vitrella brassicaformis CCMP3155]
MAHTGEGHTFRLLCLSLTSIPRRLRGVHNYLVKMQLSYRLHRRLFDRVIHRLAVTTPTLPEDPEDLQTNRRAHPHP